MDPAELGVRLPDALRWWMATYGGGFTFKEPVLYDAHDNVLGCFMTLEEIRDTIACCESTLPAGALPFHDDWCGGYLLVMPDGEIAQLVPDAPTEVLSDVAPSFAAFIMSLRPGESLER